LRAPQSASDSKHLLHLVALDVRVLLLYALLVGREVVESAIVGLGVAMLRAEHKRALTFHLQDAYFLVTRPALVLVILDKFLLPWRCSLPSRSHYDRCLRARCRRGCQGSLLCRLLLLHLFFGADSCCERLLLDDRLL